MISLIPAVNDDVCLAIRTRRRASGRLVVKIQTLPELSTDELAGWTALGWRAEIANPFQQTEFVIPLSETLVAPDTIVVASCRCADTGDWLAAVAFENRPVSFRRPLRHLRTLTSPYSFLHDPLTCLTRGREGLAAIFQTLRTQRQWHGVRFPQLRNTAEAAARWPVEQDDCSVPRQNERVWKRPEIVLDQSTGEFLNENCSKSQRKSLLRARKWLEQQGSVSFRLARPDDPSRELADFLRLEAMGWKGSLGTAIQKQPVHAQFFQRMLSRFAARHDVVFGELLIGERVIASTCNLLAGETLFGIKIGWDPEFSKGSVGYWSELELFEAVRQLLPQARRIDSCSQESSYTASLYGGWTPLVSSVFVWSRRATLLSKARESMHHVRSWLRRAGVAAPSGR